jgi:hypothetical protein
MGFLSDPHDDFPQSPFHAVSRFDPCFDVYGLNLKERMEERDRTITLIARSPASPAARALAINLARFERGFLRVGVIFAQIAPVESLNFVIEALQASCTEPPLNILRWARNRALLDAHERLTLGLELVWTGDSMRRPDDVRPAIDRVEDATPAMLAEAHASFNALWRASKPLPAMAAGRPAQSSAGVSWAAFTPAGEAGPSSNIVPLEDYLRLRRH